MILEIIAFDRQGCMKAQELGADRIELCAGPELGGVTPDRTLIDFASQHLTIPFHVMIRPRGGDFVYDHRELNEMLAAIEYCNISKANGIVVGCLTDKKEVDVSKMIKLKHATRPNMALNFHRAYDEVTDPFVSIETIIELGFDRVLTSGGQETAWLGREQLRQLVADYSKQIVIMPGSGIKAKNIKELHDFVGASEYHTSAKKLNEFGRYSGIATSELIEIKTYLEDMI